MARTRKTTARPPVSEATPRRSGSGRCKTGGVWDDAGERRQGDRGDSEFDRSVTQVFEDRDAQDLLGGQAMAACAGIDPTLTSPAQVVVDELNGR
jgi:hypothetical protein